MRPSLGGSPAPRVLPTWRPTPTHWGWSSRLITPCLGEDLTSLIAVRLSLPFDSISCINEEKMQNGMNYVLNLRVFLTSKSLAQSQNEGVGGGRGGLFDFIFIYFPLQQNNAAKCEKWSCFETIGQHFSNNRKCILCMTNSPDCKCWQWMWGN